MYLLFACGAALAFGAADFLGGLATRRAALLAVLCASQTIGLVSVVIAARVLGAPPAWSDARGFGWAVGAGAAYALGLVALYASLARGRMSVVAPVSAVCALAFPVAFGLATGDRPGVAASIGMGLAALAIVLVSQESADSAAGAQQASAESRASRASARSVLALAIFSGVGFGAFFIGLGRAPAQFGLWTLVASRLTALLIFALATLVARPVMRLPRAALGPAVCAGVLDLSAHVLYLLSVRSGALSLAATITALYPASTVALASIVLRERIRPIQILGFVCAAAAILLITTA